MICRSRTDTHKIRETNRVKNQKPHTKIVCWAGCQPRVKLCKESEQKYRQQKLTCSKLSAVVATADFQQKKRNKKLVDF
jgi:hypothetical protein